MFDWYTTFKQFINLFIIIESDGAAAAAGVVVDWSKYNPQKTDDINTGVFVKPTYRHRGLGKITYLELKNATVPLIHDNSFFYSNIERSLNVSTS